MNAGQLHDVLYDVGIRLNRDGDVLSADVLPDADIAPYLDLIQQHKPALLQAIDLRERIVRAAVADPADFDRVEYDRLWAEWDALNMSTTDASAA